LHHEADVALPPGAWQSIEIDFDGVDAQDLRELAVRANLAAVALAGR
jgi:hypothetical protein